MLPRLASVLIALTTASSAVLAVIDPTRDAETLRTGTVPNRYVVKLRSNMSETQGLYLNLIEFVNVMYSVV